MERTETRTRGDSEGSHEQIVLGLTLGGVLGVLDGCTALWSGPELFQGPDWGKSLLGIVAGSMFKGLLAGVITGAIARRMRNLPLASSSACSRARS